MLIEGPETTDLSQQDGKPKVDPGKHDDSVTAQPTSGVLLLGMIMLDIELWMEFLSCDKMCGHPRHRH